MLKNRKLSRKIQEKSWHMFKKILEEKAKEHKRKIIYIDQWYPSSKTYHKCLHINHELKIGQQKWTCTNCNTTHHRDVNAAKNILREGLKKKLKIDN